MTQIAIETDNPDLIAELEALAPADDTITAERRGLDGMTLLTIVLPLSPFVVRPIVQLLKAQIEARRHVRVIKDGTTIEGVSERTLLKLLGDDVRGGVERNGDKLIEQGRDAPGSKN